MADTVKADPLVGMSVREIRRRVESYPALVSALKSAEQYFAKQLSYYESANEPGFRRQHEMWSALCAALKLAEATHDA